MLFLIYGLVWTVWCHGSRDKGKQVSEGDDDSPVREVIPSGSHDGASSSHGRHDSASSPYPVDPAQEAVWHIDQTTPTGFRRWAAIPPGHPHAAHGFFPFCPLPPHEYDPDDHSCLVIRDDIMAYLTGGRMSKPANFNNWWRNQAGGNPGRYNPMGQKTLRVKFGEDPEWGPVPDGSTPISEIGILEFHWAPGRPDFVVAGLNIDSTVLSRTWMEQRGRRLLALSINWRLDFQPHHTQPWQMIQPIGSSEYPHGFPNPATVPINPRTGHPVVVPFGRYAWEVNEHNPTQSAQPEETFLYYNVESLRPLPPRHPSLRAPLVRASPYLIWYMTAWEDPFYNDPRRAALGQRRHGIYPPGASGGSSRRPPGP